MASPKGLVVSDQNGLRIEPHLAYDDIKFREYDSVFVPGGDIEYCVNNDDPVGILKNLTHVKLAAGICNGVLILGMSGFLDHKRCTHTADESKIDRKQFEGLFEVIDEYMTSSTYIDKDVVTDKNLITAKPWAAYSFASQAAQILLPEASAAIAKTAAWLQGTSKISQN